MESTKKFLPSLISGDLLIHKFSMLRVMGTTTKRGNVSSNITKKALFASYLHSSGIHVIEKSGANFLLHDSGHNWWFMLSLFAVLNRLRRFITLLMNASFLASTICTLITHSMKGKTDYWGEFSVSVKERGFNLQTPPQLKNTKTFTDLTGSIIQFRLNKKKIHPHTSESHHFLVLNHRWNNFYTCS